MGALDSGTTDNLIDHLTGVASYTPTGPLKLRLMSTNGTKAVAGTEVTGGSYAPATIAFGAASGETAAHSADITFLDMPAGTVNGIEIWDSAVTSVRLFWGPLNAARTLLAGDDLKFPAGSITLTMNAD